MLKNKYIVRKEWHMSRVKEGNRRLTFDIPEELHRKLRFLAVEHATSIRKYVKGLLKEYVKKVRKEN
jgi:predicted HicB family RNase H-like nuclease